MIDPQQNDKCILQVKTQEVTPTGEINKLLNIEMKGDELEATVLLLQQARDQIVSLVQPK